MMSGGRNDERLDNIGLPHHIGQIAVVHRDGIRGCGDEGLDFRCVDVGTVNRGCVAKARNCMHTNSGNEFRFGSIPPRNHHRACSAVASGYHRGKDTSNGSDAPVERKFAKVHTLRNG
jgi:hypothetical protein